MLTLPKLYMNSRVKAKWVQALLSGKFNQGHYRLRSTTKDTHCCLGVLCEVYMEENNDGGRFSAGGSMFTTDDYEKYSDGFGESFDLVPGVVKDWAGIVGNDTLSLLAKLNDAGVAFPEIARQIEARF